MTPESQTDDNGDVPTSGEQVTDTVRFTTEGTVGVITLDRPPVNAISHELVVDLDSAVERSEVPEVRAVVVTGAPHFAAGADIKAFKEALDTGDDPSSAVGDFSGVLTRLERLSKPVIAAVRGFAMGGGMELALACDFRFLADDARCGQPEIVLGIIPGAGGTQRLPRLIGLGLARHLIYTGRAVSAEEALQIGIADEVHPSDQVLEAALTAAALYATGPTSALGFAKHAINEGVGRTLDEGLAIETSTFRQVFATVDASEGVAAFLEKRDSDFFGS